MLFVNLDKLKIDKEYNFQTFSIDIDWDTNVAAAKLKTQVQKACANLFITKPAIAANYVINVQTSNITEEDFIGIVNLCTFAFFESFVLTGGRPRERRLDVPEKLQCAHISAGLLKRAVNTITVTDVFNLEIKCGDFSYIMVDTKERIIND